MHIMLTPKQSYIIIKVFESFNKVYHIKDESWEDNYLPEVYLINKGYFGKYFVKSQDIYEVANCIVTNNSDIVETQNGCLWDKALQENFLSTIPTDQNLLSYTTEKVTILNNKKSEIINGEVVSLLGVHSTVWSHFIVQFLPKLYYAAEAGLLGKNITLLVPNYMDKQLLQIVEDFVKPYKDVKLKLAELDVSYHCEKLYWIPSASYLANHASIMHPCLIVIPNIVFKKLKKNLGEKYTSGLEHDLNQNTKIYLIRRNGIRLLKNIDEVETFFKSQGFMFVDPGSLLLEEKVRIFYYARIIVGPLSSAFTNVVFSQPGVKVLEITNMTRTLDTYATLLPAMSVKSLYVTGEDMNGDVHSDYTISLERIKQAYDYLLTL